MSGISKAAKTQEAVKLLTDKFAGLGRLPKKADFSDAEVAAIKNALGPWPRALERAGIKSVSDSRQKKLAGRRAKRKAE